jgi:hypothetical protein
VKKLFCGLIFVLLIYPTIQATAQTGTPTASFVPECAVRMASEARATEEAIATNEADMATPEVVATEETAPEWETSEVIKFINLEPFDLKFNPNPDKPFAVVMNFTLFFENQLSSSLEVRKPQFQMSIEGVPWGDLASTDFQMGQIQGKSTHGIVLQSLTLIKKATPEQLAVLECIKANQPVQIELTGTLDIYPEGEKQTISVDMTVADLVFTAPDDE